MVRVTENKPEPSEKGPGLFSYLWNQVKFVPFSILKEKIETD
jgi:ionotropic glutamate receptor